MALKRRDLLVGAAVAPWALAAVGHEPATEIDLRRVEREQAARGASLCSAMGAAGAGLRGEYFALEGASGPPLLVRTEPTVDLDASLDWPRPLRAQPPRSARWHGWVKAPLSGPYRFHLGAHAASIVVARQVVRDGHDAGSDLPVEIVAGRYYPIDVRLETYDVRSARERVRLEWTTPQGIRYVVPGALLRIPSETA